MAANFRILYDMDKLAASTVTASSSSGSSRAATNVLHDSPGKSWRTASGDISAQWVKFDTLSATAVTCVGVFAHNLTAGATVSVQGNASDSWASPSFNSLMTIATDADGSPLPYTVLYIASQSYRYWRLFISDPLNSASRIVIGRVCLGTYYEVSRNLSVGSRISFADPSEFVRVPGAVQNVNDLGESSRYRQARTQFKFTSKTEWEKWQAIFRKIGNSRPCVIGLDPDNDPIKKSMYAYMLTNMDTVWNLTDNYDILTLGFEEKTR